MTEVVRIPSDQVVVRRVSSNTTVNAPGSVATIPASSAAQTVRVPGGTTTVDSGRVRTVTAIMQGPQGAPGETEGSTFAGVAGATIHGGRAVRIRDGLAYHPDVYDMTHADEVVGVAVQSASIGGNFLIRVAGEFTEPTATFPTGVLWCGENGVLISAPLASGWLMQIGRVTSATTFLVDVEEPILRG